MPRRKYKYSKEFLEPLVREARSLADVIRRAGLRWSGGTQGLVKTRILEYGLDTSHFLGQRANCGAGHRGSRRCSPEEVLVLDRKRGRKEETRRLRRSLLAVGVPHVCVWCQTPASWNGRPLVLQIDHINGNKVDNRRENLRFLCPNCHSQTATFGTKNRDDQRKSLDTHDLTW